MTSRSNYDTVIIGGGFYGCSLALALSPRLRNILILEREPELLTRASYANQARVHNGYHYPRSLVTAIRSAVNYPTFASDYADCIYKNFTHAYAIARGGSKISAYQFRKFCQQVNIPLKPAPSPVSRLFNSALIEESFIVDECAFDAARLRQLIEARLANHNIEVACNHDVERVASEPSEELRVYLRGGRQVTARYVFNCSYSQINRILTRSSLAKLPLKHETAELALVEVPAALSNVGVTVMDGPFFSTIPFPSLGLHSLSHVTYTPHEARIDDAESGDLYVSPQSKSLFMLRDAQRYLPILKGARYVRSLFETKTVLIRNEVDDGRPILFCRHPAARGLFAILGGKIDNIYDILDAMSTETFTPRPTHADS